MHKDSFEMICFDLKKISVLFVSFVLKTGGQDTVYNDITNPFCQNLFLASDSPQQAGPFYNYIT